MMIDPFEDLVSACEGFLRSQRSLLGRLADPAGSISAVHAAMTADLDRLSAATDLARRRADREAGGGDPGE